MFFVCLVCTGSTVFSFDWSFTSYYNSFLLTRIAIYFSAPVKQDCSCQLMLVDLFNSVPGTVRVVYFPIRCTSTRYKLLGTSRLPWSAAVSNVGWFIRLVSTVLGKQSEKERSTLMTARQTRVDLKRKGLKVGAWWNILELARTITNHKRPKPSLVHRSIAHVVRSCHHSL